MRTSSFVSTLGMLLILCSHACGDEISSAIENVLGQSINSADKTLNETRSFVEARIKKMPAVTSLDAWAAQEAEMRSRAYSEVIFKGSAKDWRNAASRVEWLAEIEGGPGYKIKKLRYEVIPGFWVPALLYEPLNLSGRRVPVVLNVNGHDANGKASDYKQIRCINLAKRGILAMNVEWFGMGQFHTPQNSHWLINHIDLCGASGVGLHYLLMSRAFDVLLAHEHADPERVALTGLSGGGWQTIFYSAFDTRVKLSVPVAGYSSFFTRARFPSDLGDSEQTPVDLGLVTDYAPMTAMLGGRSALLTFNAKDNCCFAADHALPPLLEAASPIFKLHGREKHLHTHINHDPGTHNYLADNRQALYRAVGDTFYPNDSGFDAKEIASDSEVKTSEALSVDLPADNLSLHQVALNMSRSLPHREPVADPRARLLEILRADHLEAAPEAPAEESQKGVVFRKWKLSIGKEWTIPAVEVAPKGEAKSTVLVIADSGKRSVSALVNQYRNDGYRVVAFDSYNTGESTFPTHAYLWSLFVATVGERPLGVQASQINAVARWAGGGKPVILVADGPRTTTAALCAAVLEPKTIQSLDLRNAVGSLKELIEKSVPYEKAPELFCFGLLEQFDVTDLAKAVAPRNVKMSVGENLFLIKK